jgi:hypothetical protein
VRRSALVCVGGRNSGRCPYIYVYICGFGVGIGCRGAHSAAVQRSRQCVLPPNDAARDNEANVGGRAPTVHDHGDCPGCSTAHCFPERVLGKMELGKRRAVAGSSSVKVPGSVSRFHRFRHRPYSTPHRQWRALPCKLRWHAWKLAQLVHHCQTEPVQSDQCKCSEAILQFRIFNYVVKAGAPLCSPLPPQPTTATTATTKLTRSSSGTMGTAHVMRGSI